MRGWKWWAETVAIACVASILALALAALGGGNPVRADQPSRDPDVRALRERFARARVPRVEDLALGRNWACEYRSAVSGSHEHDFFPGYYRFERVASGDAVRSVDDPISEPYHFTSTAMVSEQRWGTRVTGYDRLRVGPQGELLAEYTLPSCSGLECLFFLVESRSVDDPWSAVVGYRECHVQLP